MQSSLNPTPDLTASAVLETAATFAVRVPWTIASTTYSHALGYGPEDATYGQKLAEDVGLCIVDHTPFDVLKRMLFTRNDDQLLAKVTSKRYAPLLEQLNSPIEHPSFSAYWTCRGMNPDPIDPAEDADIVIFYIHGGGYSFGSPLQLAPQLVFVADCVEAQGPKIAIFALEYSLVPNASMPTQVHQALDAYTYLVTAAKVDPSKIYMVGESAGGHLVLSFLVALNKLRNKFAGPASTVPDKPAATFLLSPWIDVFNANPNMPTLTPQDIVQKTMLTRAAEKLFQNSKPADCSLYANYATTSPSSFSSFSLSSSNRDSWLSVLPSRTYITAGGQERLFLRDIEDFVRNARAEGVKVENIELAVEAGREHAWQTMDAWKECETVLQMEPGSDFGGLMKGYQELADRIVALWRERSDGYGRDYLAD